VLFATTLCVNKIKRESIMRRLSYLLIVDIVFMLLSCDEDNLTENRDRGTIAGEVLTYSELYSRLTGFQGVTVFLENTEFKSTSDEFGKWEIENVPQGKYNIRFEKEGCSPWLEGEYEFNGDGTSYVDTVILLKLPTFEITNYVINAVEDTVKIYCEVTDSLLNSPDWHYLSYVIGKTSNVDINENNFLYSSEASIKKYSNTTTIYIRKSVLEYYNIFSGDKVFVKIYPTDYGFHRTYYDPTLGHKISVDINQETAKTVEITVP
jgi:hypothetical protein